MKGGKSEEDMSDRAYPLFFIAKLRRRSSIAVVSAVGYDGEASGSTVATLVVWHSGRALNGHTPFVHFHG